MEPQVCLTQLARMLDDETSLLSQLSRQLQHEHELLVADTLIKRGQRVTIVAGETASRFAPWAKPSPTPRPPAGCAC